MEDLLPLALSRPAQALAMAQDLLRHAPEPAVASVGHQAAGIVLRDRGELPAALEELRASLGYAKAAGSVARTADVRATLGAALVMAGRTAEGLAELQSAAREADGLLLATVRLRWAHVLSLLGRHDEALGHLRPAVSAFRRAGDLRWEARALHNRCMVYLALGLTDRAESDAVRAGRLFRLAGQELESAQALHNRGLAAHQRGNLPLALRLLTQAAERYAVLGAGSPDLAIDEAAVRLSAGLTADAVAGLTDALADEALQPVKRAELLLAAAAARLAAGTAEDALAAGVLAAAADADFRCQQRPWWAARAALVGVQARYAQGDRGAHLLAEASGLADALGPEHPDAAPMAHLLAGRLAAYRSEPDLAIRHFTAAARCRRAGSALVRMTGWLAEAMRCAAVGYRAGVLHSCGRGLDALAEHRLTLGDTELRALAGAHGRELADLAMREAAARGPRALLRWHERWRATALAGPPVRPPEDAELATELAALRDVARRRDAARAAGAPARHLDRERDRQEAAVRRRRRSLSGGGALSPRLDVPGLLSALAVGGPDGPDTTLVELVEIDGWLQALVVSGDRVRRATVGPVAAAEREVEYARAALRRAAYGRPPALGALGSALSPTLLGQAGGWLVGGSTPVVLVPPARLHATPWALLPALADRPISVVPSAGHWLRSRGAVPVGERTLALVLGPNLGTGGAEIRPLATSHPEAVVLGFGTAVADRVLAALDGAWLAHVAAHGVFRADSPLFSCLELDDGPLLVHDLERLRSAPYRLVLSACDTAVAAPVGAGELLGLVTSMLGLGTAGVLASVTPVNDEATVPLMLALHAALHGGAGLATALLTARRAVAGDPVAAATGASFLAFGV